MTDELMPGATALSQRAGLGEIVDLRLLFGGGNNRVFCLAGQRGMAALKAYFRHPGDPRDRLGAEYAFSQFAWNQGLRCLPRPLACDPVGGLALYEFVDGQALRPGEVSAAAIDQALAFVVGLNRVRSSAEARALGFASESCFSIGAHLQCVERRVERLEKIQPTTALEHEAVAFAREELIPASNTLALEIANRAAKLGLTAHQELTDDERCLSPSDFGFHNALRITDGRLVFLDFEYAGWDDPAKLICDFFCQPRVPVAFEFFERFANSIAGRSSLPAPLLARAELLLPVYRLKWCCILLNEFLPIDGQRRQFAIAANGEDHKAGQLQKARDCFAQLRDDESLRPLFEVSE